MTENRNEKKAARMIAKELGINYTAALRILRKEHKVYNETPTKEDQ